VFEWNIASFIAFKQKFPAKSERTYAGCLQKEIGHNSSIKDRELNKEEKKSQEKQNINRIAPQRKKRKPHPQTMVHEKLYLVFI
jgi:hypothetical protein